MRILGIDPGLATIGLGCVEATSPHDIKAIEWLTICTEPGVNFGDRLREIHDDLSGFLAECKPDVAVIEKLFFAANQRTALDVAHARGVIVLTVAEAGIPMLEPTPLQLKSALTGDGGADKRQVQDMLKLLLKLDAIPQPDDAADALGLAVYGAITQHLSALGVSRQKA